MEIIQTNHISAIKNCRKNNENIPTFLSPEETENAYRKANAIEAVNPRATVKILDVGYDATVNYAAKKASENGWFLTQDTSWDGYEKIPAL